MRRLRTRIQHHTSIKTLTTIIRTKSTKSRVQRPIIGAALPPDDDELTSYAYYHQQPTKQQSISTSTITLSPKKNRLKRMFSKENITAPHTYNRWLIPPAALFVHMSIGSVYAWSIFNSPLTRELGVVAAAPGDWDLQTAMRIFSVSIVCLGLSAASAGKWMEKVGPRVVGSMAASLWGGGFLVGSLGIHMHSWPLLYLGYGCLGGCGLGLGYISPVSTLIKWFPDRKGMATGLAIMGFGGGAMLATPLKEMLLDHYFQAPTYLGRKDELNVIIKDGKQYVENVADNLQEVVYANAADLVQNVGSKASEVLQEGLYLVGSGDTGTCATFASLGVLYFLTMNIGAFLYRIPPKDYESYVMKQIQHDVISSKDTENIPTDNVTAYHQRGSVSISNALKTKQFYQLWTVLFCNVTAGIGVIGIAKTMMTDIFGGVMPTIVDAKFAATYVLMISVFNMVGRFAWASMSDQFGKRLFNDEWSGRKFTYTCFFTLGIPLYASIPYIAHALSVDPAVKYLVMFYGGTMMIFTMYGGGFATIPAYLADNYGKAEVGGIHGCLLTAWSAAGLVGPSLLGYLRNNSLYNAIQDLATNHCDPKVFEETFGDNIMNLDNLIDAKIVTINKLLEICYDGTKDPTLYLYDYPMFAMAGILGIGLLSNAFMKPVDQKYFDIVDDSIADILTTSKTVKKQKKIKQNKTS